MALDNFRTIELIWDKANKSIIKTIKTASSDTTGRYFSVKVLDEGQEVDLTGAKLQLYWEHPNFNTNGTDDFTTIDTKGLFKLTFSDEMLTNVGELTAYLVLTLTDGKITSDGFPIEVIKGADDGVVVPTNGSGLVEQIDGKIDKGNVTLEDLTQEVKLAMTGGSVAVVGLNSVGTENIKDEAIKREKVDGFEGLNFNLYNSSNHAIEGFYINSSGELVKGFSPSAYAKVPVNQLTEYTLWRPDGNYNIGNGALVFKDAQGNNISFVAMSTLQNGVYNGVPYITFETPANTANVLFNLKLSTFDSTKTTILVKGSALNDDLLNNKQVLKLFDANLVDMEARNRLNDFVSTVKSTGGNLYNKERDFKDGVHSSIDGTIKPASGWGMADIPVNNVSKVSIWKPDGDFSGQIGAIGFYKDNEKLGYSYLPTKNGTYEGVGFVTLTLPEGTNRLSITVKVAKPLIDNSDSLIVVEGKEVNSNALEAKLASVNGYNVPKIEASQSSKPYLDVKWTVVGDSLTERNAKASKFYHDYIADDLGFSVTNMGVGGTGYKRRDEANNAFYQRILNVPTDTEVVTIFGSFNDLGAGVPHGTKSDTGTDTLGGAINTTIDNLYSILPTIPLGIISPTPWHTSKIDNPENSATTYAKLLEDICHDRGIPFLNLYHSSGLRPWEESYRNLVYDKDPVGNGTHPNEIGHKLISTQIREFLKTLI